MASSSDGDVVLDPFCGCGTTIIACEQVGNRHWFGIDIGDEAIRTLRDERIPKEAPSAVFVEKVEPYDAESTKTLRTLDKTGYEFQWWVNRKIGGRDIGGRKKKGPDGNQDGEIFIESYDGTGERRRAIISAKQGEKPAKAWVTELASAVTNPEKKACMGILVCMEQPTDNMRTCAREYGRVKHTLPGAEDPYKIQVIAAADLFTANHGITLPGRNVTQPQEVKMQIALPFGQKSVLKGPPVHPPKGRPKKPPAPPPPPMSEKQLPIEETKDGVPSSRGSFGKNG
jgi:site-specific DNA-methyltransferase (adenine-specific)